MNILPVALTTVVGSLALYVGVLSFSLAMDANQLESLVSSHIKDIESAKFNAPVFAINNKIACMDWNQLDTSGNYESWKTASFRNTDSGWIMDQLDSSDCTQVLQTSNTKI